MRRIVVHNHVPFMGHGGKRGSMWQRVCDATLANELSPDSARAFKKAEEIDPLGYLRGLPRVQALPDTDNWNAHYDFDKDEIAVQAKFDKKRFADKVQTFLHEAGHRGEAKDPETWKAFNEAKLGSVKNFLAMCNKTHRDDYNKNGIDNPAQEVFAESYGRFSLGWKMPEEIKQFWQGRAQAKDARRPYDPGQREYTGREPVAGTIKNHPGVQEVDIATDSDYKYEVFLKEGWVYERGRMAGIRTGFFHNVADFKFANPIRST